MCWWISKQQGWSKNTVEFWTNSRTTKEMISDQCAFDDTYIVIPPYDYGVFRRMSRPWSDRKYDVVYACRMDDTKNVKEFGEVVRKNKLKGAIALLCKTKMQETAARGFSKWYGVDVFVNLDKFPLAIILGSSKVYFHPSRDESCSIAIYEAMNAGCWPVVYDVGAAREQLGDYIGTVFSGDSGEEVLTRVPIEHSPASVIRQGIQFDKSNVLQIIEGRLSEIEGRIS